MKNLNSQFGLLACLLAVFVPGESLALSCAPPRLDEAIVKNSAAIFEGTAGQKSGLNWKQNLALKKEKLFGKGGGLNDMSVYDFTVTRAWKGVEAGEKVLVLFNTYWGDTFAEGERFLIVSSRKIGGMFLSPLCGNSTDLAWAEKLGTLALLDSLIGVGHHIKIPAADRACESAKDCTAVSTHCGGCDCGTPVSLRSREKYREELAAFCMSAGRVEACDIVCETFVPQCVEGLCR